MNDTIFAVSSGSPPAAIAIIRISGPQALAAGKALGGALPPPRYAALRLLRDSAGAALDRALMLVFPGPHTATGEDVVELHVHGGRAVVAAVLGALAALPGLRSADPGEFTRRALGNGIIDTAQAEGLCDLLTAETEDARIAALAASEGVVGRQLQAWHDDLLSLRAALEAAIDFAEEGDVIAASATDRLQAKVGALEVAMSACLGGPTAERLRDGTLIVLAGPPNAGKSSLLNALAERDAAIVTPIAGTTRDAIEVTVGYKGAAYRIVDTAGLNEAAVDPVERMGIERAKRLADAADLLLWLGDGPPPAHRCVLHVHARADAPDRMIAPPAAVATSIHKPESIATLWDHIVRLTRGEQSVARRVVLRERQRLGGAMCVDQLRLARDSGDELVLAEHLRLASSALADALGVNPSEAMLDELFSRFCLGK